MRRQVRATEPASGAARPPVGDERLQLLAVSIEAVHNEAGFQQSLRESRTEQTDSNQSNVFTIVHRLAVFLRSVCFRRLRSPG